MEQVKTFYRRYRWLFLAAAYLLVFAVGVLYLRVTVNIPPEGDDKLTLNLWLYDFQRMPFWQYALQDMQGRLRYFTLQEVRFFPFHYPNAVDLLFYTSLMHYRLYIIAWTGAAAFAVSRVAARLGSGDALALGGFALALAAAPIWNEGMYSYYAVPQRALFWAMTAWLCLFAWQGTRHRRWAVLGAVLSFIACGTYEIGYVFALLALVVWLLRRRSVKNALLDTAPALGGMGAALMAFLGAELKSGIEIVTQALNLEEHIHDCTWVLTGEGRIDSQSINGKVPVGVASVAKKYHKPVIGIAGSLTQDVGVVHQYGIDAVFSVLTRIGSLEEAFQGAYDNIYRASRNIAATLQVGMRSQG